jgi:splicing factor 3B subunit 3
MLHVGLANGALFRSNVDPLTGSLTDTRTRIIGNKTVKLFKIKVQGRTAILALSSRSWLCYNYFT